MRERDVYDYLAARGEPATITVIARGAHLAEGRVRIAVHALMRCGLVRTRAEVLWQAITHFDDTDAPDWEAVWAESKRMRAAGEFGWSTEQPGKRTRPSTSAGT